MHPKALLVHPSYRPATLEYDIGLVELSGAAVLNDYVMPICFPDQKQPRGKSFAALLSLLRCGEGAAGGLKRWKGAGMRSGSGQGVPQERLGNEPGWVQGAPRCM